MTIVPSSIGGARPRKFGSLKAEVAKTVGGEYDEVYLTAAGDYINGAIDLLNNKFFEFTRYTAPRITTTAGTGSYTLPTNFYREALCLQMSAATGGSKVKTLWYVPWEEYHSTFSGLSAVAGDPHFYTLFNAENTGQVTFLPTPASSGFYDVSYFARIPILTDDEEILNAPREIQPPILAQAKLDMMLTYASTSQALPIFQREASMKMGAFLGSANKHPDQKPRFRLAPLAWYTPPIGVPQFSITSGGGGTATVQVGTTLPTLGHDGDLFLLQGPPDVLYMWATTSTGSDTWVEVMSAP